MGKVNGRAVIFLFVALVALRMVSLGSHEITSYNAVRSQTDNDPDRGAYGKVAEKGKPLGRFFACNFLAPGVKIVIPSIGGDIVWICKDRVNEKVWWRIDLLYPVGKSVGLRKAEVFLVK